MLIHVPVTGIIVLSVTEISAEFSPIISSVVRKIAPSKKDRKDRNFCPASTSLCEGTRYSYCSRFLDEPSTMRACRFLPRFDKLTLLAWRLCEKWGRRDNLSFRLRSFLLFSCLKIPALVTCICAIEKSILLVLYYKSMFMLINQKFY